MDNFNPDAALAQLDATTATPVQTANLSPVEQSDAPAMDSGFDPNEALKQLTEEKYGSGEQQLKTLGEGVGEGILGPAFTGVQKAFAVSPQDTLNRREANPITHATGQALGLGASLFGNVGVGAVANEAGAIARQAVTGVEAGKEASFLAKVGGRAIDEATQMALIQGSDEVSKMMLNDPNTSAQSAIADVGLASALGGTVGAGLGAINPLWKASGLGDKAGKFMADASERLKFRQGAGDLTEAATKEFQGVRQNVHEALDALYSGEGGGLKGEMISKALPEVTPKASQAIEEQIQKASDLVSDRIVKMQGDELLAGHTKKLERELRLFQESVTAPEANYQTQFDALNKLKSELQGYGKYKLGAEENIFGKEAVDLAAKIRPMLEEQTVWGKAAKVQQEINALYHDYSKSIKDVKGKFLTKLDDKLVEDPTKIASFIKNVGKPSAEIKQEVMRNYLDRTDKIIEQVNKVFTSKGLEAPIQPVSTNVLRASIGEQTAGMKFMDKLIDKELPEIAGKAGGAGIGAGIGHATGIPYAGAVGAVLGEHALSPALASVFNGLTKGMLESAANGGGMKSALDYGMMIAKANKAIDVSVKNVFKPLGQSAIREMISDRDRAKLDKTVSDLSENPNKMMNIDNGKLAHYMPNHQAALAETNVRAVQYLAQIKPKPFKSGPLDAEIQPTKAQMQRYNRALDIAQNPKVVLDHVRHGTLQASDIQDLNHMYPDLYTSMKNKLNAQLLTAADKHKLIPYSTKMSMSLFLGQPLDSSMQPQGIQANQMTHLVKGGQQTQDMQAAQAGSPPPASSVKNLGKSANSYMTPLQSRQQHAEGKK